MKWKYITNIDKKAKFAEMFIYDDIDEDKINGSNFAYELRYLLQYEDFSEIKIRCNSVGGSAIHGMSIFSAIINARKSYPHINIDTYCDGVAASIAALIWSAGKNRFMKNYSRLMFHGVSIPDVDKGKLAPADLLAMENIQNMIIEGLVFSLGLKEAKIRTLLENGQDNWFTSKQAIKMGFLPAENIEDTDFEIEVGQNLNAKVIQNKASEFINNNLKPIVTMKRVNAILKLSSEASEDAQVTAIEAIANKAETSEKRATEAEAALEAEKAKNATLEAELAEVNDVTADALVDDAVKNKGFDVSKKAELKEQAKKDIKGFKNMLSFLPTKASDIRNGLDLNGDGAKTIIDKIANRGFRDLEKQDASLLAEIKNTLPATYVEMYNKQYGTQKTAAELI